MRVLTWNVHHGANGDLVDTSEAIIDYVVEESTDIICLQECDEEMCKQIAEKLEYQYKWDHHNAILAKEITSSTSWVEFGLSAVVKWQMGTFNVLCLHLRYNSEDVRMEQIKQIFADQDFDIIMGDFNSMLRHDYTKEKWEKINAFFKQNGWGEARTDVMRYILGECVTEYVQYADSYHMLTKKWYPKMTSRINTRIDWVLYNVHSGIIPSQHDVEWFNNASDHAAVIVDFAQE